MKTMTQAWGWLAAGVLAAGLNASYYDGGLQWAHEIAERAQHSSTAVLALASGHADQLLAEARLLAARNETTSCRFATALARVQTKLARSESAVDRFDAMSARQEAQFARFEATRARVEERIADRAAHIHIPAEAFAPVALKAIPAQNICPRIRVSVPQVPMMRMPVAPEIHVEMSGTGPV